VQLPYIDSTKLKAAVDALLPKLEFLTGFLPGIGAEGVTLETLFQKVVDDDTLRDLIVNAINAYTGAQPPQ
jgi:hypothetical protein